MENFKNFKELCAFVNLHSWSEIYANAALGAKIGFEALDLIRRDHDVITHDGAYDTDDVMATPLIEYYLDGEVNVIRTRDSSRLNIAFTYDVGGKSFDHHKGDDRRIESDETSGLSSVGKLWLTIGRTLNLSNSEWKKIDDQLVRPIDLTDNTGQMNPFNWIVNSTHPSWYNTDPNAMDTAFDNAVKMGVQIWKSVIKAARDNMRAELDFKIAVDTAKDGVATLGQWIPMNFSYAKENGVHLITYPDASNQEQIDIRTCSLPGEQDWIIPESIGSMEGVHFHHKGGFICGVDPVFVDAVISEIKRYNCAEL